MSKYSTKAIAAVLVTALGIGAVAPALAQATPAAPEAPAEGQAEKAPERIFRMHINGPHEAGGAVGFLNFARGAEAVEVALVRLSHRIELTQEQQGLFDALRTAALEAAETFETATEGLMPQPPAEREAPAMPSITERLENRIAVTRAQLAALESVQPAAAAFFDSLTEEQKAELQPERVERGGFGPRGGWHQEGPRGFGRH